VATQYFLRNSASDLAGAGQKALSTSRGAASTNKVTNTTASGDNITVTDTAGGQALSWFTPTLNPATISGAITVNIRGLESAIQANAAAGIRIERVSSDGATVLGTIVANTAIPTVSNEYTTADAAKNASVTPTSTTLAGGNRIKVTLLVKAAAATTMGGARTVTNSIDGPTSGAAGDTFVTFTENLSAFSGATVTPAAIARAVTIPAATAGASSLKTASVLAGVAAIGTPTQPQASFIKHVGSATKSGSSVTTTVTLGAGVSVPVGRRLIIAWGGSLTTSTNAIICDDSKGNSYGLYGRVTTSGDEITVAEFCGPITTALASGDTITITQGGNTTTHGWVSVYEWSGLTVPIFGVTASGNSSSPASGALAMTTSALYAGILGTYNASSTQTGSLSSPWSARQTQAVTTSSFRWFGVWDQLRPVADSINFQPTLGASTVWAACLIGATQGTEPPTPTLLYTWPGGVTTTTATIVTDTVNSSTVRIVYSTDSLLGSPSVTAPVTPDANGYCKFNLTGLTAGTQYYYGVEFDSGVIASAQGMFKTAPSGAASFTFAMGSCLETSAQVALNHALARTPDLGVMTGDFPYIDVSSNNAGAIRSSREASLSRSDVHDFIRKTATVYTWSDHDFGTNNADTNSASKPAAQTVYRQQVPHHTLEVSDAIYHTFVYGRVRFIVTDNRSFKSPNANTDNSSKTVLGTTQKTWFKNLITSATEPLIFWVNEQPWIGATTAGDDEWSGYNTERTELGNHISSSGKKVIILAGDMHAVAYHNGGSGSAGSIPVFHAAAMNALLSSKGGPYTQGPYPTSGSTNVNQYGFVTVTDSGSNISVRFQGFDTSDTQQINATLSWETPATVAGVASFPAPAFPVAGSRSPSVLAGIGSIPDHDAFGDVIGAQPSTIACVAALAPDVLAPTVPTGLVATAIRPTEVDLSWSAASDAFGIAGYEVVVRQMPEPIGQPAGMWMLTFEDNFDAGALDTNKWGTVFPWGDRWITSQPDEIEWYDASAISTFGGICRFTATRETYSGNAAHTYKSGMIQSRNFFSQTYGYAESRIKLPTALGVWPAFWLIPLDLSWPPEIDIFEAYGSDPVNIVSSNYHYDIGGGATNIGANDHSVGATRKTWHTYGCRWDSTAITWYIDGVQKRVTTTGVADLAQPVYPVLNLAISQASDNAANSNDYPQIMEIDYVRVWAESG